MDIEWKDAPDWAVAHAFHATAMGVKEVWVGEDKYQQLDHSRPFSYGGTVGADSFHNPRRNQFAFETLRPEPWNGEGLPPAGTVCEMRAHKLNDWSKAEIKFASRNVVVWDWDREPSINGLCTAYAHDIEIRPIRTPEQIAAEERATTIQQMIEESRPALGSGKGMDSVEYVESAFSALYDAGWRKQTE